MESYKIDFIDLAVYVGALKFGQFTLKSGRISPYFFNSGVFYTGELTRALANVFADMICKNIKSKEYDVVFGPAYKGIPLAVSVCMALAAKGINKQWCFNRKEAKKHGDAGMFVGCPITDGMRVLMLDDVITTGLAKNEAIDQITSNANASIASVFILLDRQEKDTEGKNAVREFEKRNNTQVRSVINADDVFCHLSKNKINGKLLVDSDTQKRYFEYKEKYGV